MSITKTGVRLTPTGGGNVIEEYDTGAVNQIYVSGLAAATEYTVEAYIVNDGQTIWANTPDTFTTLAVGTITTSNVSAVWGTSTKQLTFSCNWATTRTDKLTSLKIRTSSSSTFDTYTDVSPNWSQEIGQGRGTIQSVNLTTNIPNGGGSTYYVRLYARDNLGYYLQTDLTFTVPTQSAGYMTYNLIQQSTYGFWMPTTIHSFTYAPATKYAIFTHDNWATTRNSSGVSASSEIFFDMTSDLIGAYNWSSTVELCVIDIYGNTFRTNQGTQIKITKPYLRCYDNGRGVMRIRAWVNPYLTYTQAEMRYTDNGTVTGTVSLLPITQGETIAYQSVPDGTYSCTMAVTYTDGGSATQETSDTVSVTILNRGYLEITRDNSTITSSTYIFDGIFDSGFPMATASITAYVDDDDYELIGTSELTISGTTSGRMTSTTPINGVSNRSCLIVLRGTDTHNFDHSLEFWSPPE